jgi:hypothetical protein
MPLDPSIILGAKPVQIDMAQFSPMTTLTNAMKLRQLDQEGELNALTLKERKDLQTFLPGKDLSDPDVQRRLASQFGEAGRKIAAGVSAIGTAETTEKKRRIDTAVEKSKMYNNALMDVTDQRGALQWLQDQKNDPDMAASPIANVSIMDAASRIPADPAGFAQWKQQAALGLSKYIELNKPVISQVNRSGQTDIVSRPGLGGALTTLGNFPDVALPPLVEQQKIRIGLASRPVQNVNLPPQEKAEQADRGKMLVAEYSDISKAAKLAAKILPSIDANLSILDKGFSTGFGTETIAAGAKVLSALGVANADKFATNAQVFQSKATEAVLQKQLEQKGPQTESDAQRIDQIGAQLGKTTAGNRFVLTTAKEQLKRDMEQRNFYDGWWKQNKTYDGAEDAWYSGEGGKSLFDRPALKTYLKTAEAPAAAAAGAASKPSLDSIFKPKRP